MKMYQIYMNALLLILPAVVIAGSKTIYNRLSYPIICQLIAQDGSKVTSQQIKAGQQIDIKYTGSALSSFNVYNVNNQTILSINAQNADKLKSNVYTNWLNSNSKFAVAMDPKYGKIRGLASNSDKIKSGDLAKMTPVGTSLLDAVVF